MSDDGPPSPEPAPRRKEYPKFFRRFLFSTLRQGTGRFASYAVSALAFGLMHGNPALLPLYLWIAVCATLAYERTGTIWAAIAVHAANNSFAVAFWET